MALQWTGDLNRIVNSAERDATKMSVRLNTALLLRSMLKNTGPCQGFLANLGLNLDVCESGLRALPLYPESSDAPQHVYERAAKIASCARAAEISSVQVLLAMLEEPCMCQSLLRGLKIDVSAMRTALYGYAVSIESHHAQYIQARATSSTSMNAVAVQRKSTRPTVTTYIEPEPAASFGADDLADEARLGNRKRLMTPDEINRLPGHQSGSQPSLPFCDKLKTEHLTASPRSASSSYKAPGTYHSTSSKEIQQAATLDLARRLMMKKSQTNEARISSRVLQKVSKVIDIKEEKITKPLSETPDAEKIKSEKSAQKHTKNSEITEPAQDTGSNARELECEKIADVLQEAVIGPKKSHESRKVTSKASSRETRTATGGARNHASPVNGTGTVCARKPAARIPGFSPTELDKLYFPALTQFGRNLLSEALLGHIDPVIDRDEEINQLIDVINKRRSNNPILVGEPGVGKTAIIEGLAVKMARHDAPKALDGRTIIALDYGAIISGTQLRGAVQERIKKIKDEIKKADGRIILFLDEIHCWVATANGDPNADASMELKMALSRGELMCIGTSTPQELRRAFNADPAFERRFDFIEVKEPSAETAVRIIKSGIIEQYAKHHDVTYEPEAIREAVRLSERYVQERALPDKAISVLDRAGSICERAGEQNVTSKHIAQVISQIAEIPVERLLMSERQKLMELEKILGERLIGHEDNIAKIASVIRRNHAGFGAQRPIGSFLFLGPTGVGKTETAKVLADFLFGSPKNIIRFDMSEFMEQHSVAKLIGAPAGYVGFDDGGLLTEALRKRPYQIVLFDEIEKAHPDVWNILLQILDEGRLTDAKGRHVDFSNTVIIMTSNLGAQNLAAAAQSIGFANDEPISPQNAESIIINAAKSRFSPELWNRIEEKLVFHPLEVAQIESIAHLLLADSAKRLYKDKEITLSFDENVLIPYLIRHGGFEPSYGARPMRQTIQTHIESKVAEWIITHEDTPKELFVGIRNDLVYVEEIHPL